MKKAFCIFLALSFLLLTACGAKPAEISPTTTETIVTAPDFTAYTGDGKAVQLSNYFGKPIVLNFWASWCPPCKAEMPDFEEAFLTLGDQVQFLMVNLTVGSETLESASGYVASQNYTFPVLYDTKGTASYTYGIQSIPTTFFIDAEGNLVAQATGAINAAALQQGIDMILPQ